MQGMEARSEVVGNSRPVGTRNSGHGDGRVHSEEKTIPAIFSINSVSEAYGSGSCELNSSLKDGILVVSNVARSGPRISQRPSTVSGKNISVLIILTIGRELDLGGPCLP